MKLSALNANAQPIPTAAMSTPYLVGPAANTGVLCFPRDEVHAGLKHYHELGYQLAIHAIGDVAIEPMWVIVGLVLLAVVFAALGALRIGRVVR